MRLKNFIKKQKKDAEKTRKGYISNTKVKKGPTRAEEKRKVKGSRRIVVLSTIGAAIFILVVILFSTSYLYRTFILKELDNEEIISPGTQNVIQIDKLEVALKNASISFEKVEYSTTSGALTFLLEGNTIVYLSDEMNPESQIELLKRIIRSLKLQDKTARVIDLRYNKAIVKF